MSATVSGLRYCCPSSVPPLSSMRQSRARSAAVENIPAWPATPPSRRDRPVRRDRGEPRAVGQDPPDGDGLEPPATELTQIAPERLVELDRAALDERHHGERRAEGLRERGDVEDRCEHHRRGLGNEPARGVRAVQEDLVAPPDEDDDAGDLPGGHQGVRGCIDAGEVRRLGGGERWPEEEQEQERDALSAHLTILALL